MGCSVDFRASRWLGDLTESRWGVVCRGAGRVGTVVAGACPAINSRFERAPDVTQRLQEAFSWLRRAPVTAWLAADERITLGIYIPTWDFDRGIVVAILTDGRVENSSLGGSMCMTSQLVGH